MKPSSDDLGAVEADLLAIADAAIPQVARLVKRAVKRVQAQVATETVVATPLSMIPELWDWDEMLRLSVEKDENDDPDFDAVILALMAAAALLDGGTLDIEDPFLLTRVERDIGNMVIGIRRASKAAIRRAVLRAAAGDIGESELVQIIRRTVGLTPRSANAVFNYREALVRLAEGRGTVAGVLRRFTLAEGVTEGLTRGKIERLVKAYGDRLLDERAIAIARTETVRAVNAGRMELWRQQMALGEIPPDAKKVWRTAADERVCPICAPLDGRVVAMVDRFTGISGVSTISPPIHTRCRCWLTLEV